MTHRCKHVDGIADELREAGATDIAITREGRQVRVAWALLGRRCSIVTMACPRDEVVARNTGRQAMRRACREARVS